MRILIAFIRATHPIPALAVTVLVGAVAAARGAGTASLAWVIASTAAGQASVGWSNDFLDRFRDAGAGRHEKPLVRGDLNPTSVLAAALLAFPLSVLLSLPLGVPEAGVMLGGVASAWAYNAGLKATVMSWLPYALSFGLAPLYVWLAASDDLPPAWIVAGAGLLGVAAHLLNVVPDLEADRRHAVRGLPHRMGLRGSVWTSAVMLAAVLGLVLAAGDGSLGPAQIAAALVALALIAAAAYAGLQERGRLAFRLAILAAAAIVAVFLLSGSKP